MSNPGFYSNTHWTFSIVLIDQATGSPIDLTDRPFRLELYPEVGADPTFIFDSALDQATNGAVLMTAAASGVLIFSASVVQHASIDPGNYEWMCYDISDPDDWQYLANGTAIISEKGASSTEFRLASRLATLNPAFAMTTLKGDKGDSVQGDPGATQLSYATQTADTSTTILSAAESKLIELTLTASTELAISDRPTETTTFLYLMITQDATGGWVLSLPAGWYAAFGEQPMNARGANDVTFAVLTIAPSPAPIIYALSEYRLAAV